MATRTMLSATRSQPQQVHAGLNVVPIRISASVTISVGDTWVIGKIPHGAIPIDAVFFPAAQTNAKFGTSASLEQFLISATYSIGLNRSTVRMGTAFQISVSDDAAVRYENIVMTAGTTDKSLGYFGDFVVSYVMPGQSFA